MTDLNLTWDQGTWTNEPVSTRRDDGHLIVEAVETSDAWRETSYGFVHDTEHALVTGFDQDRAMEVDFDADFSEQFDQAGLFIRADETHWIKAGLEFSDGLLQVGAVVTWPKSDWSVAPVPQWNGTRITVRASRTGDAITIRARSGDEDWQFVRVIPVPEDATLEAGPLICAPTRAGLKIRFTGWRLTAPDASLH